MNGVWVEGDEFDWVRPSVEVLISVNPETTLTVAYPPSTPTCDPNPPDGEVATSTGTPTVTLPPTDSIPGDTATTASTGAGLPIVLAAMAILALILVSLVPVLAAQRAGGRRERR